MTLNVRDFTWFLLEIGEDFDDEMPLKVQVGDKLQSVETVAVQNGEVIFLLADDSGGEDGE